MVGCLKRKKKNILTVIANSTPQEENTMTRQEMQNKLDRKDITGVGVKVTWGDNNIIYYFYEDFENSKGIDRAAKHFSNMINKGKVRKAEYIYQ